MCAGSWRLSGQQAYSRSTARSTSLDGPVAQTVPSTSLNLTVPKYDTVHAELPAEIVITPEPKLVDQPGGGPVGVAQEKRPQPCAYPRITNFGATVGLPPENVQRTVHVVGVIVVSMQSPPLASLSGG